MFAYFSFFCALRAYLRKIFMHLWLLGVLACKDFKSWESRYVGELKIQFQQEKDELAPQVLKDLGSQKLSEHRFIKEPAKPGDKPIQLTDDLCVLLEPDACEVGFVLEDNTYYHRVTVCYEPIVSMISPAAGGLQIQYLIKDIRFDTKSNKRPIFKRATIEHPVPLKEKENEPHVTLYY